MKAELQKSGALPLHVVISLERVDALQLLAKYLRKHVSRFQTLRLVLESVQVIAMFLSVMGQDCPAPLLQRLTLDVFETEGWAVFESITLGSIFHPSPCLKYLSIPPTLVPAVTNSTFLPTVKHFTFDGEDFYDDIPGPERVITLLSQSPLMESFTFRSTDVSSDSLLSNSIVMPHLLSADVSVPGTGLEVLSGINSPLLQRVHLDGHRDPLIGDIVEWDDHPSQLLASTLHRLSRYSPKISHLELVDIVFNDPKVTYPWIMSGGFPSLEVLKIDACNVTDGALRLCKPLQMMKKLELVSCELLTGDGLLHVVEGRSSDFELNIDQCRNITQVDGAVLSAMVKVLYTEYNGVYM